MRLGRKLSEGFVVDREAESGAPAPAEDRTDRAVPVTARVERDADATPVASGQPPTG